MLIFQQSRQSEDSRSPNVRLLKTMGISSKDILLNREGTISPWQKGHMRDVFWFRFIITAGMILYFSLSLHAFFQRQQLLTVWWFLEAVLVLAGVYAIFRHRQHMATQEAAAFTGRVKKGERARDKDWFLIVIDDETQNERIYKVNWSLYEAFIEGERYTVYSPVDQPKKVIGAEHAPNHM